MSQLGASPSGATVGECLKTLSEFVPSDAMLATLVNPFGITVEQVRSPASWANATPASEPLRQLLRAYMLGRTGQSIELHRIEGAGQTMRYGTAEALFSREVVAPEQVVESLFERVGLSCIYGASNSGKSFLAIDLACAIARGVEWLGRYRVDPGVVLYLATEASRSVERRLQAYQREIGAPVPNFALVAERVNLFEGALSTNRVVDTAHLVEDRFGLPVRLIVGDTLAAMSIGASENKGEDMGRVIENASYIVEKTDSQFVLIHHTGKDEARGMRGWSGLRAALDTEAEVVADDETGARSIEFTKQKDLTSKGKKVVFELQRIEFGTLDNFGNPVSSAVVTTSDRAAPLRSYERARREGPGRPNESSKLILAYLAACPGHSAPCPAMVRDLKPHAVKTTIYRSLEGLIAAKKVVRTGETIRLSTPEEGAS